MKNINKYDLALSVGRMSFLEKEGLLDMQKAGIKGIELSFDDYSNMDFKGIKTNADECGISLWSLHLPFLPFEKIDISSTDPDVRKYSVDMIKDIISRSAEVGINRFVVHASGEPVLPPVRSERKKCSKESLFECSEFLKKYNGVIAVENLPRTCLGKNSNEINELTSVNDNLNVCFDTNHLLEQESGEFLKNLNKKIETLHVSDYDFVNERHWLPFKGSVDWAKMIENLEKANYNGPWLYEVSFKPKDLPELSLMDINENHRKIFENR